MASGSHYLLLAGLLAGCAHAPRKPVAPPATVQESCAQLRGFFSRHGYYSVAPADMSAGCHLRITSERYFEGRLSDFLRDSGWSRDLSYGKGAVPTEWAWETPSTRCTIEQIPNPGGAGISVGAEGGGHLAPTFGIGLGINGSESVDYKIDCAKRS